MSGNGTESSINDRPPDVQTVPSEKDPTVPLNVSYVVLEVIVAVCAFAGNLLVVLAFIRDKRLRKLTNYYVVSLAVSDLLVGILGVPCAVLASVGLPNDEHACLVTITTLIMLCTISIFNLVAVSVDRYWAILYPLQYSRCMTGKMAIGMIICCWVLGVFTGLIPFMGWRAPLTTQCHFTKVMDYDYLAFLYFATILAPSVLMGYFYIRIYIVVIKQLRQISALSHRNQASNRATVHMLANKKEVNAAKILFIIVSFFVLCWFPLYTMNTIQAFCTSCIVPLSVVNINIILSHLNSAVNPILYAYHLRDFREAFKQLLLPRFMLVAQPSNIGGVGHATSVATAAVLPTFSPSNNSNCTNGRQQQQPVAMASAPHLRSPVNVLLNSNAQQPIQIIITKHL
ncbi:hypothetical protein CHUAL_012563 [Chamberlinius hualienensis]